MLHYARLGSAVPNQNAAALTGMSLAIGGGVPSPAYVASLPCVCSGAADEADDREAAVGRGGPAGVVREAGVGHCADGRLRGRRRGALRRHSILCGDLLLPIYHRHIVTWPSPSRFPVMFFGHRVCGSNLCQEVAQP